VRAEDRIVGATDILVVGYALVVALLAIVRADGPVRWRAAGAHLLVAALVLAAAALDRRRAGAARRWMHRWLPVIVLPWLYAEAGRLRHLVVGGDLDRWIVSWDDRMFPGRWYLAGERLSAVAIDALHAVYFSYYLLLFVPALVVERRRPREAERYILALVLTLLGHYALDFLVPVSGPVASFPHASRGLLFVPTMRALYFAFDHGGLAFPSTHVAAALVAAWFAGRRFFPDRAVAYAIWFGSIAVSTVGCGYHYPIDVVAGLLSGAGCLALARSLSHRLES